MRSDRAIATALLLAAAGLLAGLAAAGTAGGNAGQNPCAGQDGALDPAEFTTRITNPYFPQRPGSRWVYRETDAEGARQRVVVEVTKRTKLIANGVLTRVVHDRVIEGGKLVEETFNWYAQDGRGTVWDLGEHNREYKDGGSVDTSGSFEAGVGGTTAGIAMPARPRLGLCYRIETEDRASVASFEEQVEVPFGHFPAGRTLMIEETKPQEPRVLDYKFYARGIGMVLALGISGGSDREELLSYSR